MDEKTSQTGRSLSEYLLLMGKGFCMGAADVIPGVSGGTMAFIMGIYEELLLAIKSFDLESVRLLATFNFRLFLDRVRWKFLLALCTGILAAIFTLARILTWLLVNQPIYVWSFFFGLILASVLGVSRRIGSWRPLVFISLLAGITGIYMVLGLAPVNMPHTLWFLFISGAIAICAMILPGISGAFVMVLLGQYQYVLEAVNQKDFLVLFVVAAGAAAGISGFSRILSWLLKNCHDFMIAILTGLMLGSLRKVWPWKQGSLNVLPAEINNELVISLALMASGLAVVLVIDKMGRRS
ncbi:MAG: DUF368 domain-containing protein [Desulfobacteraceae bacterium]|nr:MAG: DUF368 domain-containing protein [Desulfobacteraceae bacterium]